MQYARKVFFSFWQDESFQNWNSYNKNIMAFRKFQRAVHIRRVNLCVESMAP